MTDAMVELIGFAFYQESPDPWMAVTRVWSTPAMKAQVRSRVEPGWNGLPEGPRRIFAAWPEILNGVHVRWRHIYTIQWDDQEPARDVLRHTVRRMFPVIAAVKAAEAAAALKAWQEELEAYQRSLAAEAAARPASTDGTLFDKLPPEFGRHAGSTSLVPSPSDVMTRQTSVEVNRNFQRQLDILTGHW